MGSNPHALYSSLSEDLLPYLSKCQFEEIRAGAQDWPGMTSRQAAAASLVRSLLKKIETGMTPETQARALDKFLKVDNDCKEWVLRLDEQPYDDLLLGEFKRFIERFWRRKTPGYAVDMPIVDSWLDVLHSGGVGPGSAIGSPGGDFYSKLFSSKLSVTDLSLYNWYKRYIRWFPDWRDAEISRTSSYGEPDVVTGNRLSFVPKNDDISRSICTEPVLNMFFQLGLGAILTSRLKDFSGIDLEVQQFKNRELARKGSLDGSFATIDLSSASDSIGLNMLRWALPKDFLSFLTKLRSPETRLPNGKLHVTNMVSTMGNGFTFPLQTVIFTCVVMSAMRLHGVVPVFPRGLCEGNFGVNGDDIVVPTGIAGKVLRLLHLLGFTANKDKTFVEGPFRESCGGDYHLGGNIRGVYIKRLRYQHDYFSVINQLNLFSTRTGILLPRLVQKLLGRVEFLPIPKWENEDAGIRVPWSLISRKMKVDRHTQSTLYFARVPVPPPRIRICDSALVVPRSFKRRIFNPFGLMISLLQGSVNSDGIPLLPKEVRYRRKPRVASNWDIRPPVEDEHETIRLYSSRVDWERWNTATYLNLFK